MSQGVIACRASDSIVVVEELMVRNRKQRIVVVDDEMRSVGVIAVPDLFAHDRYETVVGTHGRRGVRRLLLGSVAEHVVRAAPCPVTTIRAQDPSRRTE
jgi:CBS domain-containing protein